MYVQTRIWLQKLYQTVLWVNGNRAQKLKGPIPSPKNIEIIPGTKER